MRGQRLLALLIGPALITALAACSVGRADSGSGKYETTTIRYQSHSGGVIDLAELADALGYLGPLKLERVGDYKGGPESLQGVATGQVDFGAAFNGATAKLASTGAPVTSVVAYYGSDDKVDSSLFTRKDSDVRSPKDLIGKKIAVNTLGANAEAVLDTYLRKGGLTESEIDKVTLVPLPSINIEQAIREGQVEAGYLFSAGKNLAVEHGGLRELVNDVDLVGEYSGGTYVLRDDFIAKNPNTTKKFVEAIAKAIRYTQQHSVKQVRGVLADYLKQHGRDDQVKTLGLWEGTGIATKGGVIRDSDYKRWLDWLESEGEVETGSVEVEDIYTNKYNPYAEEESP